MKSFFIIGSILLLILHAPTTKAQAAEEADSPLCNEGTMQSPVDLTNVTVETVPDSEQVFTFYQPSNTTLLNRGHDIAVEWTGDAGSIEINGINYRLQQLHWHVPSEHTIDGKRYDLERHAVHVNLDTNETAVIGALYQIGEQDPFLSQLMTNLTYMVETSTNETDPGVIDPSDITSTDGFYRYIGSLTTPPCTEDIVWTVQSKIRSVSQQQVDLLLEAVHGNENARPLQPINGRDIYLYVPSKDTAWSIIFSPKRIDWNIIFSPLQYLQQKFFSE
ncbi:hypothetical protein DCAR_0625538 [Daucus carota subsp. sativus]|uniref:Alpha-carbonic anhydrase domain-containing protein n=1 Tax=Daucus carota subsp. sativus TaxID=79200 RepID=A0AAF0XE30_DAUCS|nr:PREDICTED: alpha carbonic anhydrase 7-like [Daucus carota subsp. sativus]WOH06115.1 hypothetical protein DCAR_0625538 [Daucus carota subsp. sativus]